jgi:hypothetical protein
VAPDLLRSGSIALLPALSQPGAYGEEARGSHTLDDRTRDPAKSMFAVLTASCWRPGRGVRLGRCQVAHGTSCCTPAPVLGGWRPSI